MFTIQRLENRYLLYSLYIILYLSFLIQSLSDTRDKHANIDFNSYFVGAQLLFEKNQSPYDEVAFNKLKTEYNFDRLYPFVYPPPSLFLFYPISKLSYSQSKWLSFAINHAILIIILYLIFRFFLRSKDINPHLGFLLIAFYILHYEPIRNTIEIGQTNLIILLALMLIWKLSYTQEISWGKAILIGALVASLIFIKIIPGLIFIMFLFRKQYKVLVGTMVFSLLLVSLSFLFFSSKLWQDWLLLFGKSFITKQRQIEINDLWFPWNISINGFFNRLFVDNNWTKALFHMPLLAKVTSTLFVVFIFTATLIRSYRFRIGKYPIESLHIEFALYILMIYLLSPISWGHHLTFLLPSILVVIWLLLKDTRPYNLINYCIAGVIVVLAIKIPYWHKVFYGSALNWFISIKTLGAVALWFYLMKVSNSFQEGSKSEDITN